MLLHLAALDSFHCGIIFHCVNMPVYASWPQTFWSLAVFCYYEWLFNEHSYDSLKGLFLGVQLLGIRDTNILFFKLMLDFFSDKARYFCFGLLHVFSTLELYLACNKCFLIMVLIAFSLLLVMLSKFSGWFLDIVRLLLLFYNQIFFFAVAGGWRARSSDGEWWGSLR